MSKERPRNIDDWITVISAQGASSNAPTYEKAKAEFTRILVSDVVAGRDCGNAVGGYRFK